MIRIMSFKELRKMQKIAALSTVGPGRYDLPENKLPKVSFGMRTK